MAFEEANLETNPGNGATYLALDKVVIYHFDLLYVYS